MIQAPLHLNRSFFSSPASTSRLLALSLLVASALGHSPYAANRSFYMATSPYFMSTAEGSHFRFETMQDKDLIAFHVDDSAPGEVVHLNFLPWDLSTIYVGPDRLPAHPIDLLKNAKRFENHPIRKKEMAQSIC